MTARTSAIRRRASKWGGTAAAPAVAALSAAALASAACSPGADAGPSADALPTWTVSADVGTSIGELDGDDAYVLSRVAGVTLLDDGGVAVADGASSTIRVYDADGTVRSVNGGPGAGPGEYGWINALRYRPPDTLVVFDADVGRLTTLVDHGTRVGGTVTFRADDGRNEIYLGRFPDGSHALARIDLTADRSDPGQATADQMRIARFAPDGAHLAALAEDTGLRRLGRGPVPFSPYFAGVVVGGTAFHGDGLLPRLSRTDASGRPSEPLRIDLPVPGSEAAWAAWRQGADSSDLASLEDIRGAAVLDSIPAFSDLLADADGRLWVKEYDPAVDSDWRGQRRTGGSWLVTEPDGTPVARVTVPDGFRLMDVRGGLAAGVSRDELGVERVEVRTLARGPGG